MKKLHKPLDIKPFTLALLVIGSICIAPAVTQAQQPAPQNAPQTTGQQLQLPPQRQIPAPRESIAALVNDEIITTFDLRQRIKMMTLSSGGRIRPEEIPLVQQQALRDLVNDRLKEKELEKFEVKVRDREVESELQQIASQTGLTLSELQRALQAEGISIASWKKQISTSIGWQNLVQGRFRDRVKINEREIDLTLETIREEATKEQYLVSELCIPVEDRSQVQAYYQAGLQLIEQMRRGVPFAAAAQQFSGCTSASLGGDIGWVQSGELPKELDDAIKAIPVGSVTNPIPSEGALIILALRDKKEPVTPGEVSFTLAYASAPLSIGENTARLALEKLPTAEVCNARAIKLDLGPNVGTALLENVKISEIAQPFRRFVEDLNRGDLSTVIEADGYLHVAHICEKDEGLGVPPRIAIENRIYQRQLSLLGQRYLRDLERKSTIELRLSENGQQPSGR